MAADDPGNPAAANVMCRLIWRSDIGSAGDGAEALEIGLLAN
jgi:hypothetical protein